MFVDVFSGLSPRWSFSLAFPYMAGLLLLLIFITLRLIITIFVIECIVIVTIKFIHHTIVVIITIILPLFEVIIKWYICSALSYLLATAAPADLFSSSLIKWMVSLRLPWVLLPFCLLPSCGLVSGWRSPSKPMPPGLGTRTWVLRPGPRYNPRYSLTEAAHEYRATCNIS